jgi:hypothetical protein
MAPTGTDLLELERACMNTGWIGAISTSVSCFTVCHTAIEYDIASRYCVLLNVLYITRGATAVTSGRRRTVRAGLLSGGVAIVGARAVIA